MREKRRALRIEPFVVPCLVEAGKRRGPGFVVSLSERGARVSEEGPGPRIGQPVAVEVRFRGQAAMVRLTGRVRWVRRAAAGSLSFGLTFGRLRPEARETVKRAVAEFQRRAALLG